MMTKIVHALFLASVTCLACGGSEYDVAETSDELATRTSSRSCGNFIMEVDGQNVPYECGKKWFIDGKREESEESDDDRHGEAQDSSGE